MESKNSALKNNRLAVRNKELVVKTENSSDGAVKDPEVSQPLSTATALSPAVSNIPIGVGSSVSISLVPAVSVTPVVEGRRKTDVDVASVTIAPSAENLPSTSHSVSVIKRADISPSISEEPFTFKTPPPVRQALSATSSQASPTNAKQFTGKRQVSTTGLPSKSQSEKVDQATENQRITALSKKKPSVKIASFAKTSEVDRPSTSGARGSIPEHKSIKRNLTSLSSQSTEQNLYSQHPSSSASVQYITQTSLPTPALNAALRSFFNYGSKPDASTSSSDTSPQDGEEDEDEEEEILVYMQFDSKLDSDLLQAHTPFKIIGVDSEKPVLQLGNQVFEGNWTDTVGTAVFFEEHPSASPGDPVFMKNPPSTLKYHSKTQKSLIMSRIFVKPNNETADSGEEVDLESNGSAELPIASVEVAP